ncbi:MAG: AmmeMemoRadiSam system protein B [Thermoproteota archaeon]|jgi:AmmeMemoRadiSam system protein B
MIRRAAVAGYFYESEPNRLKKQIEKCFEHTIGPGKPVKIEEEYNGKFPAFIVPHAGYIYSGPVAAHSYKMLVENEKPDTVVILGPNHTGMGSLVSIMTEGEWETPLGRVKINKDLALKIIKEYKVASSDYLAHLHEHSIEVQLPFLQYFFKDFDFVPICILLQTLDVALGLANALYKVLQGTNTVVLASTDLNHYEDYDTTYKKDSYVIEAVRKIDAEYLMSIIEEKNVSMCGPCPTATVLAYCKKLGVSKVHILKHANSGDTEGPKDSVVGYLATAFEL